MACKITAGVTGTGSGACSPKQGGNTNLHIVSKEAILSFVKTTSPAVKISGITLNNIVANGGDVDHKFYKIATKDKKMKFSSVEKYDKESESTVYETTLVASVANDDAQSIYALRQLFGIPICILVKENGVDARWKIAGLTGGSNRGLYLTEKMMDDGEALNETKDKLPKITIMGEMDEGWYYLDAGSKAATEALIATLTA